MHDGSMRTTIEIADDKLVRLKQLAAERGERGFSILVDEALEEYLAQWAAESREQRRRKVAELHGAWDDETAEAVRARIAESRRQWR